MSSRRMNCNNEKLMTYPGMTMLHDNRCFSGKCIKCNEWTYYCQHMKAYICCEHCENNKLEVTNEQNNRSNNNANKDK